MKRYIKYTSFGILLLYVLFCQSCMTMRMNSSETRQYFNKLPYADRTLKFDGHSIHYIETGHADKPTLFFVHGSPGSWDAYKSYLNDSLLLKKYRMIAVDRPGFGYSDFGDAENLATQAKLLEKVAMQTDNHQPVVLIGHSLGGPLIVKMAADNPSMFQHLVILAGAVDPKAEKPEIWRNLLMRKPLRYLIPGALRTSNDELWWLKSDLFVLRPELKKITAAAVVVHGTKDQLVPYSNMDFLNAALTHAASIDNISIENANHFIPWEHFDLIRNTLLGLKL